MCWTGERSPSQERAEGGTTNSMFPASLPLPRQGPSNWFAGLVVLLSGPVIGVAAMSATLHSCATTLCPHQVNAAKQFMISRCQGSFSEYVDASARGVSVQVVSLASTLAIGALCGLAAGVLGFFLGRKVATTPSVGFQLLPKSTW